MHRLLSVCVLAFCLSGCETLNTKHGWLPSVLNDDAPYLQQLSRSKAAASPKDTNGAKDADDGKDVRMMQSTGLGLVYHPELEQLLNAELQRIRDTSGFTQVPGRVYIMASPTMNALTTADGNIYIPMGMLMDIQSMDELDALLAHEFAHTVLAHTDSDLLKVIQKKGTAAYAVVNRLGMNAGNAEQVNRRIRNGVALYMATEKIISPTWNRKQEGDADKLAVDLLVKAGRNLNGMTALLSRVDQWDKINAGLRENDKPKQSMLVAAATSQLAQNEWQALLMQALDPVGRQIEDGIAQAGNTHFGPQERLEDINAYVRTHYRKAARPTVDDKSWRKTAHSQKSKRLAQGVVQSHLAYRSVSQNNGTIARKALAKAKHRDLAGQTFYQLALAMLADDGRKTTEVMSVAQSALGNPYPSYRLQIMAQQAKALQQGKTDGEELKALYEEFDRYGRPVEFYYDLIRLAEASDNKGLKLELVIRCQVDYFGDAAACSSTDNQAAAKQDPGIVNGFLGLFGKK